MAFLNGDDHEQDHDHDESGYEFRRRWADYRRRVVLNPAERRQRLRRGVYLLPSLFTLGNMFCGYLCLLYAIRGEFEVAAPFIGIAIVLDMLDGRIARLTRTESAFGIEFDSLADVISFGMAPAVLVFQWGLGPLHRMGWAAGFIYLAAGAIRLARFNIQTGSASDKRYFLGMPIPAAAAVLVSTVYFHPEGFHDQQGALVAFAITLITAFLMVSTIKFRSFKTFDLRARLSYKILGLIALAYAALQFKPQILLLVVAYAYLVGGLIGWVWGKFRRRRT